MLLVKKEEVKDRMENGIKSRERKERCKRAGICLGISLIFLAVCSKSSFLYPMNDWEDANIFFTVGKSIVHGKVLYRDVFDHKGPLLYFLHSLAYLISKDSFLGVYVIEVLAFTAYLLAVYQTLRLYVKKNILLVLPLLTAAILSSKSFCHGDSAEELILPLAAWSLYASLRYFKNRYPEEMDYRELFVHGILAGCIMLIKFTLLGFHFAWMLMILLSCLFRGKIRRGVISGLVFVGGMAVTTIPFLFYFWINGALDSWFTVYFYNNVFVYSNLEKQSLAGQIKGILKMLEEAFLYNWKYSVFTILGVLWLTLKKGVAGIWEKWNLWMLCICTALGISWGIVYMHPYYPLILSVFACLGWIPVLRWLEDRGEKAEASFYSGQRMFGKKKLVFAAVTVLSLLFAWKTGNYTDEIGRKKEDVVQYQFREIIRETENPSLLNFGFMDGGFYTVCDILPPCKYFCKTNMPGGEWIDVQLTLIGYGMVDYIVTMDYPLSEEYTKYELAATGENYHERQVHTYYLYRKAETGGKQHGKNR